MVLSLLLQNMQKAGSPRTEIMQRLRCGKNYQKFNIEREEKKCNKQKIPIKTKDEKDNVKSKE
jgi:hypothetical protein